MIGARLNVRSRREIVEKILLDVFGERRKKLHELECDLADVVYEQIYTKDVQALMKKLPDGFLASTDRVNFYVGGQWRNLPLRSLRLVGYTVEDKRYPAACKVADRLHVVDQRAKELRDDEQKARAEISAVLHSCTTVKKLVEVWPEVAPYVDDAKPAVKRTTALTVSISDLNKHLGFPRG